MIDAMVTVFFMNSPAIVGACVFMILFHAVAKGNFLRK